MVKQSDQIPNLYLASQSPRRKQLLESVGLNFEIIPVDIDETPHMNEPAEELVIRLAREKSTSGLLWLARSGKESDSCVLAADTLVVIDNQILGKPLDRTQGVKMLSMLSARTHTVLTAAALAHGELQWNVLNKSRVTFKKLSLKEIEDYWDSGEPVDKAGGYAIQGLGSGFVCRLEGSYTGVMGLPMYETRELLMKLGIDWL